MVAPATTATKDADIMEMLLLCLICVFRLTQLSFCRALGIDAGVLHIIRRPAPNLPLRESGRAGLPDTEPA
jgi:hypothetical protein